MAMNLSEAAVIGNVAEVQRLVAAGADVNEQGEDGWRPLHYAAAKGHVETVKLLAQLGAELDVQNARGETPLEFSVRLGHHQLAEVLRELERTVRGYGTLGVGAPQLPVGGVGSYWRSVGWRAFTIVVFGNLPKLRALPIQYVL
jgi:hypothetical protein